MSEPCCAPAHHWLIDKFGQGQCKYCHEVRQFDPGYKDYHGDYRSKGSKVKAAKQHGVELEDARRLAEAAMKELEE
jgi:hypothetical protein